MGAVGSLPAITLENNDKSRRLAEAENGFAGGVGGGTETAVEQSLGHKPLILLDVILMSLSDCRLDPSEG
jgi:hypothetical protein